MGEEVTGVSSMPMKGSPLMGLMTWACRTERLKDEGIRPQGFRI